MPAKKKAVAPKTVKPKPEPPAPAPTAPEPAPPPAPSSMDERVAKRHQTSHFSG